MKRCSLLVKLALLICAAMTVVTATHTSLAYITAKSNTLHNSFRVEYLPPQDITVPVVIQKSMLNLSEDNVGPGGFDFHLINTNTGETLTATSSDDGRASMLLTFTADDVGKTYHYRLYELNSGREHVTYDDTVYDISITLVLNEMHEMSAQLKVNGQPVPEIAVDYENQYYVTHPLPDTGDHAPLLLWTVMLMISGTGLFVLVRKEAIFRRQS